MNARPLVAAVALLALAACGPSGPAIQEVRPSKGEQNVAADAPVRVVFNHDMDRGSVESRFSMMPAIEGCDRVSCPLVWKGRTMTLNHPLHQFAPDTHYRVSLKAGYRDAAGRAEGTDHFWDFRSEAAPSIGSVVPGDGTTGAGVDADIYLQLSRNVLVPPAQELTLTGAGDPEPVPYRVGVSPEDPRKLVISPLVLLRPRTAYTLHVGSGISDSHHNPLGTPRDVRFVTGNLALTHTLAFLVRDRGGTSASAVAILRPPAGLNAPAPSVRILHRSSQPIRAFAWSSDSTAIFVLGDDGRVARVGLDGQPGEDSGMTASAIAANPSRPEVALVSEGVLHVWRPGTDGLDIAVPQAGQVRGAPAWSGDGRRIALAVDDGRGGAVLRVVDRETLSVADIPGTAVPAGGSTLAWSFDGSALAFTTAAGEVGVYRPLAAQGSGVVKVGVLETTALAWSSDGGTLFAAGSPSPGRASLLYRAPGVPVEGQAGGFVQVSTSRAGDRQPAAPSFDRRFAFLRPAAGVPQVWIMNNDGTATTQLTFATYDADARLVTDGAEQLRWSPGNAP
ncbi:MAG: hypothetical protein NVSMB17_08380 [Candidatus Dormibacteria bacterium]